MYDAGVVDIPLFLIRRGRRGGGNYLDMTSWTFVWAKKQFCLAPTGHCFKP